MLRTAGPVTIFYSYAHEDEALRGELEKHLTLLQRQGLIATWYDRKILGGQEWKGIIDQHLEEVSLILLLISPDFLASDYCYEREMQRALERQKQGTAYVLPIILRPVDWQNAPFAHLQCLPRNGTPITEWENQDIAFREIARNIRTTIEQIRGVPAWKSSSPFSTGSRSHRQRLLKRVRSDWINGVLEQSLHQVTLIALGLHERPDALPNPWHLTIQEMNHSASPLPEGTRIAHVYDDADGELLLLGEPGAGKTTLLLELARDLLERAEEEMNHPVPVVFNLSSWATKRQPLERWLVEELHMKYWLPLKVATSWINSDQIIILLDGLDEVASASRSACIEAINAYQQVHDLVSIVVCSRSVEYFAQASRLLLQKAVMIQPLTSEQIEIYLSQAGEQLEAVRLMLHDDLWLRELTTTPLMLSILILTYRGKSVEDFPAAAPLSPVQFEKARTDLYAAYSSLLDAKPDTQQVQQARFAVQKASEQLLLVGRFAARRRRLFTAYVERMLYRRSSGPFPPQRTIHWLSWLAKTMVQHDQMVFSLDMPLDKLSNHPSRAYYILGTSVPGLLFGLLGGLAGGLAGGLVVMLRFGLLAGLLGGLAAGLVTGLAGELRFASDHYKSINNEVLRWYLYRAGSLPWRYRRFLDYAAEHILLRKVGNSYIFVHRLLLEYFASLNPSIVSNDKQETTTQKDV